MSPLICATAYIPEPTRLDGVAGQTWICFLTNGNYAESVRRKRAYRKKKSIADPLDLGIETQGRLVGWGRPTCGCVDRLSVQVDDFIWVHHRRGFGIEKATATSCGSMPLREGGV